MPCIHVPTKAILLVPMIRCHRTRKECVQAGSRRRRLAPQLDPAEKIIELQSKLDRLVDLLENVAQSPDVSASLRKALDGQKGISKPRERPGSIEQKQEQDPPPRIDPAIVSSSSSGTILTDSGSTSASTPVTSTSGHDLAPPFPGVSCSSASHPHTCNSSPQDADICLQAFRTRFLPFFPFIYFTPKVDARYVNRLVLIRAIMTVARR